MRIISHLVFCSYKNMFIIEKSEKYVIMVKEYGNERKIYERF